MVSSNARTVDDYVATLAPEPRHVIETVRDAINARLPVGYEETMAFGMIGWVVPLSRYPDTYNRQPLGVAALAAQKHHYAVYLECIYTDPAHEAALRAAYAAAGMTLDLGKSCLRFKSLDGLLLDAVVNMIAATPVEVLIARYEASRAR